MKVLFIDAERSGYEPSQVHETRFLEVEEIEEDE